MSGTNILTFCSQWTWEDQQSYLARILLIEIMSIYEGWCSRIRHSVGLPAGRIRKNFEKWIQFPDTDSAGIATNEGIGRALAEVNSGLSPFLTTCMVPSLRRVSKCGSQGVVHLNRYLIVYRYFKEMRNCISHSNSTVSSLAVDWHKRASALSPTDLGIKEVPRMLRPIEGDPAVLSLRGVVGMSDVIIRLLTTLDAELAGVGAAETVLLDRWKEQYGSVVALSSQPSKRENQIKYHFRNAGLPTPFVPSDAADFLKKHAMVDW